LADANEFRHFLRQRRMERGLSQDALGAEVHVSGSQIGHYESGRSIPPDELAKALDAFLGTGDECQRLVKQARGEAVAPWLRPWKENEERAILIRTYQPNLVPGLLQTEEYARAILAAGPHTEIQVEERTRERMARQAATLSRPDPAMLTAIIGEAMLRHDDPNVMKDQLDHLVDIGHRPNVHIRVLPFSAGLHAGLTGAFAIATLPTGAPVVYLEDQVEGKIGARLQDIRHVSTVWETLCARALPCDQSRNLILRVIDDYEERAKLAKEHPFGL
jgi:transcriptional regulator with XRE-family HTH domain